MIHHSTDFPFSWKILHERPHLLLSVPITPSLRCEKVLKILATAVVHPYSFWIMGSNPGALSFLTWALNFAFLVLVATLTLMDSAPLVFIDLPIEGALRRATEFVHGGNSVAGSGSLPPTAAEEISSESPQAIPFGGLGFLGLHITFLERSQTPVFPYFGYLDKLALSQMCLLFW